MHMKNVLIVNIYEIKSRVKLLESFIKIQIIIWNIFIVILELHKFFFDR